MYSTYRTIQNLGGKRYRRDLSPHPKSNLNPNLESLETLGTTYKTRVYATIQEMLQEQLKPKEDALDGVIVATPHATHYEIAKIFLEESMKRTQQGLKPINILLEKPMTTDVKEAYDLMNVSDLDLAVVVVVVWVLLTDTSTLSLSLYTPTQLVQEYTKAERSGTFLINHSANYRQQAGRWWNRDGLVRSVTFRPFLRHPCRGCLTTRPTGVGTNRSVRPWWGMALLGANPLTCWDGYTTCVVPSCNPNGSIAP